MEKLNDHLLNLFTEETNKSPTYRKEGVVYHTLEYVNWLEKRAAEIGAQNTSHNSDRVPCSECDWYSSYIDVYYCGSCGRKLI